ncbi:ActS/PrrB/RegB family redox-sensitive histidine kinase [Devosia sp. ZB163]|uniref:ActS/PrrB/RegB family redox-sensitive histidine kinase n=1 Tax=Devosia sp. ZB163 TaxID=3025938 RepID=UPI00235EEAD5|nr:ActS/PrrB/RegB family redox-sensitive histidine kinase [Devosia sp. ZB163]MDC9822467.1 ActS/PrrB/RegB family redox-sensitive histidine kinase [Devosia sp. ZB163]
MALADSSQAVVGGNWRPLRLGTLVGLRWLAIVGQTIGVFFVEFGLGFPLPLTQCLLLIGLSVLLNLWLGFRLGEGYRLSPTVATVHLGWDLCQLGALLALTGGLQNPFSLLLLAPVSVSATTLTARATIVLAGLAIVLASLLSVFHLDLPWDPDQRIVFDRVYVIGIWVSILCGTIFIAAYTNRVAHEARQLADALAATELALSRHEQLNALDGLAAAAAHELGTPLSTIALVAREMRDEVPEGPVREDAELIMSQAARCREILGKLRSLRDTPGDPFAAVPVSELLAEVIKPLEGMGKSISIRTDKGAGPEPVVQRNAGLLYGLGNLIENAAQFAHRTVLVETSWDKAALTVTITDDGPGFPADLIARLGEPYLTTRPRDADSPEPGGLGLGIFISKTLLERTGARLRFENEAADGHARVRLVWPRAAIERG